MLSQTKWLGFLRFYAKVDSDPPFLLIPKGGEYIKGESIHIKGESVYVKKGDAHAKGEPKTKTKQVQGEMKEKEDQTQGELGSNIV